MKRVVTVFLIACSSSLQAMTGPQFEIKHESYDADRISTKWIDDIMVFCGFPTQKSLLDYVLEIERDLDIAEQDYAAFIKEKNDEGGIYSSLASLEYIQRRKKIARLRELAQRYYEIRKKLI